MNTTDSIIGCILGTAVGDALGLCCEGMSRRRQRRMFGEFEEYHFFFGRGMISDDTEHTTMVAQALIASGGDPAKFTRSLAWRLRFWVLGAPAGIGFATLRSLIKLWIGFPGTRSGVFSAGNGPAMRSAIIGVSFGADRERMRELVSASTRVTHIDPKAEHGSLAVALAARMASETTDVSPQDYLEELATLIEGDVADELLALLQKAAESVAAGASAAAFADSLGQQKGITGYVYDTVPAVMHCWFAHPTDFKTAILELIRLGGDTDTTAAILGGIMGAGVGKAGMPGEWIEGLWEWPRSVGWMQELGRRLAKASQGDDGQKPAWLPPWGVLIRNAFFMVVVLAHGFRRIAPPY